MILETKRLLMREMSPEDFPSLCLMLMDADVMYAYGHAFSQAESKEWLERQLNRYKEYRNSFGLYAVILKSTGRMIGQCGITVQDFSSRRVYEIGYLLQKSFWHMGYALEAAQAWRECARCFR